MKEQTKNNGFSEGKSIVIDVTKTDIDFGEPRTSDRCPVALAIRRDLNTKCIVSVVPQDNTVFIYGVDTYDYIGMEDRIAQIILEFDQTRQMKPFTMILKDDCLRYETRWQRIMRRLRPRSD